MATHSSVLAWEIPWTEELGGLQSMGSQRVRRNWAYILNQRTHLPISPSLAFSFQHLFFDYSQTFPKTQEEASNTVLPCKLAFWSASLPPRMLSHEQNRGHFKFLPFSLTLKANACILFRQSLFCLKGLSPRPFSRMPIRIETQASPLLPGGWIPGISQHSLLSAGDAHHAFPLHPTAPTPASGSQPQLSLSPAPGYTYPPKEEWDSCKDQHVSTPKQAPIWYQPCMWSFLRSHADCRQPKKVLVLAEGVRLSWTLGDSMWMDRCFLCAESPGEFYPQVTRREERAGWLNRLNPLQSPLGERAINFFFFFKKAFSLHMS